MWAPGITFSTLQPPLFHLAIKIWSNHQHPLAPTPLRSRSHRPVQYLVQENDPQFGNKANHQSWIIWRPSWPHLHGSPLHSSTPDRDRNSESVQSCKLSKSCHTVLRPNNPKPCDALSCLSRHATLCCNMHWVHPPTGMLSPAHGSLPNSGILDQPTWKSRVWNWTRLCHLSQFVLCHLL